MQTRFLHQLNDQHQFLATPVAPMLSPGSNQNQHGFI